MRTGIGGEILAAPQEALVFFTYNLKKQGAVHKEHVDLVRTIIQEKIYFEPIMKEVFKHIPEKLYEDYMYLYSPEKRKYAFTDDTTLSIAIMDAIMKFGDISKSATSGLNYYLIFREALITWGRKYLEVGYGKHFKAFIENPDLNNYASVGNGAAMRTAAIGYLSNSDAANITVAYDAARVSHGNPEAIRGALAVTDAVAQSRKIGATKESVKLYLERNYYYDLGRTLAEIRPTYKFESIAVKSVPEAIISFLESSNGTSAIENAISLGGDTDTQAMIAGCIADAFYGYDSIPQSIHDLVEKSLPFEMMTVLEKFENKFILN